MTVAKTGNNIYRLNVILIMLKQKLLALLLFDSHSRSILSMSIHVLNSDTPDSAHGRIQYFYSSIGCSTHGGE